MDFTIFKNINQQMYYFDVVFNKKIMNYKILTAWIFAAMFLITILLMVTDYKWLFIVHIITIPVLILINTYKILSAKVEVRKNFVGTP